MVVNGEITRGDIGRTFQLAWEGGATQVIYYLALLKEIESRHVHAVVYVEATGCVYSGFVPRSRFPIKPARGRKGELRIIFDLDRPAKRPGNGLLMGHLRDLAGILDVTGHPIIAEAFCQELQRHDPRG